MRKVMDGVASGSSDVWKSAAFDWIHVNGTFDGVSVVLEARPTATASWVAVGDSCVFTEAAWHVFRLPAGVEVRATLVGPGGSTSIDLWVN